MSTTRPEDPAETERWERLKAPSVATDGRTDPGGGSALDAAIEAAARAIEAAADEWEATSKGDITRMQADAEYYDLPGIRADDAEPFARVAVRAAEPILRQAVAEQIANLRRAYELKVADLARETAAVTVLAERLTARGCKPDGWFAEEGHSRTCPDCVALRKALRREDAAEIAREVGRGDQA